MTRHLALARLQADFADAVLGDDLDRAGTHLAGDPLAARARLAIYRRSIAANRRGALRAAFPVVVRLVGDGFFEEAALRHGEAAPPGSADLNRYGSSLPEFLAAYPHASAMPWLADVARLEWAWHVSSMAEDAGRLDFAALALVPEEGLDRLCFRFHPGVRLVRSRWPVLSIWEANQPGRDGSPEREEGADNVLVWREEQRVRLALLSGPEAVFTEAISRGMTLQDAVACIGEWDPAAMLRRYAEHGMLRDFSADAAPRA
jgi:hypothetical protein